MSEVHFIGGEKGGVGKSVVARLITQYWIDKDQPLACIDADQSHGALLRHYADFAQGVDLEEFESADQIMDRALASDRKVLVDLPAQSARALSRWMESGAVLDFAREMGVKLYFWHVSDGGYDSINELSRALSFFGNSLQIVVVKNFGRCQDFSQLDQAPVTQTLLAGGGRIVSLPALHAATMFKIDRSGASFWAAVTNQDSAYGLSPMERQRTRLWLNQAYAEIEKGL